MGLVSLAQRVFQCPSTFLSPHKTGLNKNSACRVVTRSGIRVVISQEEQRLHFGRWYRELWSYSVSSEVSKGQQKCLGSRRLRAVHHQWAEVQRAAFSAPMLMREAWVRAARLPLPVWLHCSNRPEPSPLQEQRARPKCFLRCASVERKS